MEATFLEEFAAWAPEASPWSFKEKKRPEVETRLVDTGLGARTGGGRDGKEFWGDTLRLFLKRQINSSPKPKIAEKMKKVGLFFWTTQLEKTETI